jgi:hypothetical protein
MKLKSSRLGVHDLDLGFGFCISIRQHLAQRHMLYFGDVILFINKDHMRYQRTDFLLIILAITDDNDDITFRVKAGGCPIQTDNTGTTSASNRVRLQARTVRDVDHLHLFVWIDVGGLQQVLINRDTADVMEVCLGHSSTVDLPFTHCALHCDCSFQNYNVRGRNHK